MAETSRLRNEDFRKLLATPSVRATDQPKPLGGRSGFANPSKPVPKNEIANKEQKAKRKFKYKPVPKERKEKTEADELAEESESRLSEIMTKYRDRAAERRKEESSVADADRRTRISGITNRDTELDAAARRKQEIKESKYLGGDIEHTHLVKGLDYSLLNKARGEIQSKPEIGVQDEIADQAFQNPIARSNLINTLAKTPLSLQICKVLFEPTPNKRSELFQKGRMAYVVELEDDAQNDVPVTLLRSTVEVVNDKAEQNINANNIIINKLTDVLSYLRADGKKKRKEKTFTTASEVDNKTVDIAKDVKIYDDIDEYVPDRGSSSKRKETSRSSRRHDRDEGESRRGDRDDKDRRERRSDRDRRRESNNSHRDQRGYGRKDRDRSVSPVAKANKVERDPFPSSSAWKQASEQPAVEPEPKKARLDDDDAYAELFPSADVYFGGGDDSDEEDFSKMDSGPKKGPIKRWDFETQEEYEKYQSGREALPKAVFQYGVKTQANRKTRKAWAAQEDKKFDKELEKIEKIWEQRRQVNKS